MIRFMFYAGGLIEGDTKEEYVRRISHKITRLDESVEYNVTEEDIIAHPPISTLREKDESLHSESVDYNVTEEPPILTPREKYESLN